MRFAPSEDARRALLARGVNPDTGEKIVSSKPYGPQVNLLPDGDEQVVAFPPCECCGQTDEDTGNGLCGCPVMCEPCRLTNMLMPDGLDENEALIHAARHRE